MAQCDQGYLCDVCGEEVEYLPQSDLYLRYVIGEIALEVLHTAPERHLRCNPTMAQFIVHQEFQPPCIVEGMFDKRKMDPSFVAEREQIVSSGFERLLHLHEHREAVDITRYPFVRNENRSNS